MKYLKSLLPLAVCAALFASCEKNDNDPEIIDFSKGVYIVNEGSFNAKNGSISFYDPSKNLIIANIFETVNGYPAGDVLQSFSVVNDTIGYIMANNSHKVEVVRLKSFEIVKSALTTIYPRYFIQVNATKGYISAYGKQVTGYLYTVDLTTHEITDSILTGAGPEVMLKLGDRVYVANSGGFYADSTVSIINTITDEVVDTINVGQLPADLALDADEHIWVYCRGYSNWVDIETESLLQKIDPVTQNILWQVKVGMALDYTSSSPRLAVSPDGSVIYYLRPDGIYFVNAINPQVSTTPLIAGNFYGLEVNPSDGNIYALESGGFTANGKLKIYSTSGNLITEGVVGIGPNGAAFNL